MSILRRDPMLALAGLLGLWLAIELLHSSRWLEIGRISQRSAPAPSGQSASLRSLADLVTPATPPRGTNPDLPRVWFAPYTTFPESGMVESSLRRGVYDTFLAIPRSGIATNYGAFKLSASDSAFSQASSAGLAGEATLARKLGYDWFAVDLGAVNDMPGLMRICRGMHGCRVSQDGYALFHLDDLRPDWMRLLAPHQRLQPEQHDLAAASRWGSVVFEPGRWWPPRNSDVPAGRRIVWAQPVWSARIYRYGIAAVPTALRPTLVSQRERIWLRLAPGLMGADVCLQNWPPRRRFSPEGACTVIRLRPKLTRIDITAFVPAGQITRITAEWLYGEGGLPITPEMIPAKPGPSPQPSSFGVEVENPEIPAAPPRARSADAGTTAFEQA
jgi:hypothetical protein